MNKAIMEWSQMLLKTAGEGNKLLQYIQKYPLGSEYLII